MILCPAVSLFAKWDIWLDGAPGPFQGASLVCSMEGFGRLLEGASLWQTTGSPQPPITSVPSGVWASREDGEVTEGVLKAVGGKVVTCAEGAIAQVFGALAASEPLSTSSL